MKKLMLFSMWLAASAAAVGVASAGVSVVDSQVVDPPPAAELASRTPGETANVNDANEADTASTAAGEPSPDPTANQIEGPAEDGGYQSIPSTAAPSPTPRSQTTPRPTTSPARPASTSTQPTATTPLPTQPPSAPPPPTAATQTFVLTGGTAAISFSSSGVEVLWATPNPGFDVRIEPESPGIKVEFRADHHRSRVDAWWSGGPQHSIREEPRD